jgi:anti-anti-sigma factor
MFVLSGELDLATMDSLIEAVQPDIVAGARLTFDMSDMAFMDGSGFRVLLQILTGVGSGGQVRIERPSSAVRRVLELVGAAHLEGLVIVER